jgi:hypothetical protein
MFEPGDILMWSIANGKYYEYVIGYTTNKSRYRYLSFLVSENHEFPEQNFPNVFDPIDTDSARGPRGEIVKVVLKNASLEDWETFKAALRLL